MSVKSAYEDLEIIGGVTFIRGTALRERDGHVCFRRLAGKRCNGCYDQTEHIGWQDHLSEWKYKGKTVAIVSQPYDLTWEDLKLIIAFCESRGFEARFSATSYHYPGATVMVMITKVGTVISPPNVKRFVERFLEIAANKDNL